MNRFELVKSLKPIWRFPFVLDSGLGKAIFELRTTEVDFLTDKDNWFSESGDRYSANEMKTHWNLIKIQRTNLKAAVLVLKGKYRALNPALNSLHERNDNVLS